MAHLPLRREALVSFNPVAQRQQRAGLQVIEQMYEYFSFEDLPICQEHPCDDYDRAA